MNPVRKLILKQIKMTQEHTTEMIDKEIKGEFPASGSWYSSILDNLDHIEKLKNNLKEIK